MLKLSVKTVIPVAKQKFLSQLSINKLVKHNPDFYKSILEAADRGELWGVSVQQSHFKQLKFDFYPSKICSTL